MQWFLEGEMRSLFYAFEMLGDKSQWMPLGLGTLGTSVWGGQISWAILVLTKCLLWRDLPTKQDPGFPNQGHSFKEYQWQYWYCANVSCIHCKAKFISSWGGGMTVCLFLHLCSNAGIGVSAWCSCLAFRGLLCTEGRTLSWKSRAFDWKASCILTLAKS